MIVDLYLWNTGKGFPARAVNINGVFAEYHVQSAADIIALVESLGGAIVYPPSKISKRWLVCIGHKSPGDARPKFGQR